MGNTINYPFLCQKKVLVEKCIKCIVQIGHMLYSLDLQTPFPEGTTIGRNAEAAIDVIGTFDEIASARVSAAGRFLRAKLSEAPHVLHTSTLWPRSS